MPLRRQARYKENNLHQFIQDKNTKLRVLQNKQVWSVNNLSVYKHINLNRRQSGSLSSSSRRSRGLSVNLNPVRGGKDHTPTSPVERRSTVTGGFANAIAMPNVKSAADKIGLAKAKYEAATFQFNKNEVKKRFDKLSKGAKRKIVSELETELLSHNKDHDVRLLKVKSQTISGAVQAYKDDRDTELNNLQVSAIT